MLEILAILPIWYRPFVTVPNLDVNPGFTGSFEVQALTPVAMSKRRQLILSDIWAKGFTCPIYHTPTWSSSTYFPTRRMRVVSCSTEVVSADSYFFAAFVWWVRVLQQGNGNGGQRRETGRTCAFPKLASRSTSGISSDKQLVNV